MNTTSVKSFTWYVRDMLAVPVMAIVGWGTDKTKIPELALVTH